jgi:ABC-type hemin transport system substrate-binding protein
MPPHDKEDAPEEQAGKQKAYDKLKALGVNVREVERMDLSSDQLEGFLQIIQSITDKQKRSLKKSRLSSSTTSSATDGYA